jgi:hypothetical protein
MFTAKTVACIGLLGLASIAAAQIPDTMAPPPLRVEMKPVGTTAATGALGALSVALEIQAVQPNVPAGLRATVVLVNSGAAAVEFADPQDSAQLELQGSDGKALRAAPAPTPGAAGHVPGARSSAPVRLAPKESRRIELALTEVLTEGSAPAPSPQASPGTMTTNTKPLLGGAYRVRARTRITPAQGKPADGKAAVSFESGWIDVTLGGK